MPNYTLSYFDINGRAEFIRLAFVYGGVPFENRFVTFPEFQEAKAAGTYPNGQLPVLSIDERMYAQSNAILRYVGKLTGTYPEDPVQALVVDGMMDLVDEMQGRVSSTMNRANFGLPAFTDEDEKKSVREALAADVFPKYLANIEKTLSENGTGWLVGDSPTIADFRVASGVSGLTAGFIDYVPTTIADPYPHAKELVEKVNALPAIAAWRESEKARKEAKSQK